MTAPWCKRATVAAPFRPAKLPRRVSLVPASCAVASPAPVVFAAVEASMGTGRKRTLKLCCAPACSAITAPTSAVRHPRTRRVLRRERAGEAMGPPSDSLLLFRPRGRFVASDSTERRGEPPSEVALASGLGRPIGPRMPQRFELGLGHVAVEHHKRQAGETEPPRPGVAGHELMRDQPVVADTELALDPAVFVHFGVQRARAQRCKLARRP